MLIVSLSYCHVFITGGVLPLLLFLRRFIDQIVEPPVEKRIHHTLQSVRTQISLYLLIFSFRKYIVLLMNTCFFLSLICGFIVIKRANMCASIARSIHTSCVFCKTRYESSLNSFISFLPAYFIQKKNALPRTCPRSSFQSRLLTTEETLNVCK